MNAEIRHVHPDRGALATACAQELLTVAGRAVAERGRADLVLTGGSTGIAVVAALPECPAVGDIDFSRVHFWFGDERWVPTAHEDRNDQQAMDAGLAELMRLTARTPRALRAPNVHRFPARSGSVDLDTAARQAAAALTPTPAFDVVLLGMGPDAHVASLFPGHPALDAAGMPVVAVRQSPKPPSERLSLTLEAIGAADQVWFTVAGADKADAVASVVAAREAGRRDPALPASLVDGRRRTVWWLDEAAAG